MNNTIHTSVNVCKYDSLFFFLSSIEMGTRLTLADCVRMWVLLEV